MLTIIVTPRIMDNGKFHACIEGHPELWGAGRSLAEAVGACVMNHGERHFKIDVHLNPHSREDGVKRRGYERA